MYETRTVEIQFEDQCIINQNQAAFQINEILYVEVKKYVLLVHNMSTYELKTHIKLLMNSKRKNIENIFIPANAQIILPLGLTEIDEIDSMRVTLTGEVLQEQEDYYPIRIADFPKQIPLNIH
ncbi:hypothetical protein P9B03_05200 [Metasolibacillus meyeri]|uniref:SLAP domain-containing protein n=1 Tax=Metasolibacillus meyeri TaxID=1071052 RepID=A0AAW9NJH5_9BACL|nr:hypothetical protein [Metasolibacillus meyeri]MEC1177872.1 hypothetical protein [Metasolibacillus meyeri]